MVIEFAQNILKLEHANSTEIDPDTPYPVIIEMPEFNPLQKGGTMRLGLRKTLFTSPQCHATTLYGTSEFIFERHRHRFEFNVKYKKQFEEKGFRFVAQDETGTRMEIVELPVDVHPYFIGVQYHPEFLSRPLSPSPVFKGLVQSSISHSSSRQIKHNE
uniref:CTP synthase (glutamine hydrolyzing) n=1 Tax=Henneguya salminicola TaxID=69463 RepID=A0A6G3MHR2_HENSL